MSTNRSWIREPFCGLSHLAGAILSVVGMIYLVYLTFEKPLSATAFAVYGASLVVLYTASALYHSLQVSPENVKKFQRMDHVCIFFLIAGTYTPICMITMRGAMGWGILAAVYGIAVMGTFIVLLWKNHPHWIRVTLYIVMGWLAVLALPSLFRLLPPAATWWLIAGGLAYTVGTVVYATDKPHLWPGKFSAHDLWHVFVLAGSICHFILMLRFVAPAA